MTAATDETLQKILTMLERIAKALGQDYSAPT